MITRVKLELWTIIRKLPQEAKHTMTIPLNREKRGQKKDANLV